MERIESWELRFDEPLLDLADLDPVALKDFVTVGVFLPRGDFDRFRFGDFDFLGDNDVGCGVDMPGTVS